MGLFLGSLFCFFDVSIPLPIPHSLDYCGYILSLKIGRVIPPTLSLFYKIVSAILVPLFFHMNFTIILSISSKNHAGILIAIVLNLYINFERIDIFTMLSFNP